MEWAAGQASNSTAEAHGLFRLHCAHCHGVSGDGMGPTARFLNPYPRDYRKGLFKFTSTQGATTPPTMGDLKRTLRQGIPGTAMPSFILLSQAEIDALVEYVKYLALRGQVETLLFATMDDEGEDFELQVALDDTLKIFVGMWDRAEGRVMTPAPHEMPTGKALDDSIAAGEKLYLDQKRAKCSGCHGPQALGDGQVQLDDWNEKKKDQPELYSLPLQQLNPRNLRLGIYRGGRRPVDLYRRIFIGIKGAKMPAAGGTLKTEEIWQLVDYVRSLPYQGAAARLEESEMFLKNR